MVHINDYLDYVLSDANDVKTKKFRSSFITDYNENGGGTAGEVIYTYAKNELLGAPL